jgi:hypothetical protein
MVYGVLEDLPTGIWILNPEGATVSINRYAQRICRLLLKTELASSTQPPLSQTPAQTPLAQIPLTQIPQPIQRLYQAVVESRDLFPERPVIIEDAVQLEAATVHLRARWLELELDHYVLVMLESQQIHPIAKVSKLVSRELKSQVSRRETELP